MRKLLAIGAAAFALAGCASRQAAQVGEVYDPYEGLNRRSYAINEAVDQAVVGPVARGYARITPKAFRIGLDNAFDNLNSPAIFVNDWLQLEPDRAGDTLIRFVLNTTIGIGGFWDAGEYFGIEKHSEDFGQTLGKWGVGEGPYLVVPLLGPSNTRDAFGSIVDIAFNPLLYIEFAASEILDDILQPSLVLGNTINTRALLDEQLETLRDQPEPYVALRRAYTSQRRAAIRNGVEDPDPFSDLPDFDDFEDEDF